MTNSKTNDSKTSISICDHRVSKVSSCKVCKLIEKAKRKSIEYNQKILSFDESNHMEVLLLCEKGHQFNQTLVSFCTRRKLCPECKYHAYQAEKKAEYFDLATKNGGEFLSDTVTDCTEPQQWRCSKRHTFKLPLRDVRRGRWCTRCDKEEKTVKLRAYFNRIAKARQATILNIDEIFRAKDLINFKCKNNHNFEVLGSSLMQGTWCKLCQKSRKTKVTLETLKHISISKGGKCHGTEPYTQTRQLYLFSCAKNHTWEMESFKILNGFWCPECDKKE